MAIVHQNGQQLGWQKTFSERSATTARRPGLRKPSRSHSYGARAHSGALDARTHPRSDEQAADAKWLDAQLWAQPQPVTSCAHVLRVDQQWLDHASSSELPDGSTAVVALVHGGVLSAHGASLRRDCSSFGRVRAAAHPTHLPPTHPHHDLKRTRTNLPCVWPTPPLDLTPLS